ncbi:MAG: 2-C-methyl-D-erythritol 4-phosphate cytidylyltransferase [Actinomycetota bacterium]
MPAAGIGERARSEDSQEPKQFQALGGRPVLAWAVDAVASAGCSPVVVVLAEARIVEPELGAEVVFTAGGDSRQESVAAGLELVDAEVVVVHDAARPFAPTQLVTDVIEAFASNDVDAVVPGVAMDETIKEVDLEDSLVTRTVDRGGLWRVQTPAAFRTAALKHAHARAREDGFVGTDESQLVERYGRGRILIIPGRRDNLKITFPEDLVLAEAMLEARR